MNRQTRLLFVLLFVFVGLVGISHNSAAQTGDQNTSREVIAHVIRPAQQRVALRMWTREALAAAQPLPLPVDAGTPQLLPVVEIETGAAVGGSTPSGDAAANADEVARAAYPTDWTLLNGDLPAEAPEVGRAPDGSSQVYTSYYANYYSQLWQMYPHKWVGRLSFTTPSGTGYCSASAISGNNIVTAAHCIYDTTSNVWYGNWVFTPAYRGGAAPYGNFAAQTCWILTTYANLSGSYSINTWARHDVAVCHMGNNSAGQTLNSAVGYLGRSWDATSVRHFHNLGYPFKDYNNATLANAGRHLRLCAAESALYTTETLRMGCNFGSGISGGPWMVSYAPFFVQGQVNSVNSGLFLGTRNLYGPRFNTNNIVPLCNSAGC